MGDGLGVDHGMSVLNLSLSMLDGAYVIAIKLSAIGAFLYACWKLYRAAKRMSDKITKTYNSVGVINGDGRTIAENVKDTRKMAQAALYKYDEFALWRGAVDVRLENIDRTLHAQNGVLDEIKARQV